jgi:hypothetical protein
MRIIRHVAQGVRNAVNPLMSRSGRGLMPSSSPASVCDAGLAMGCRTVLPVRLGRLVLGPHAAALDQYPAIVVDADERLGKRDLGGITDLGPIIERCQSLSNFWAVPRVHPTPPRGRRTAV